MRLVSLGLAAVVAAQFLHGAAAMVRPQNHVIASKKNGNRAAKKKVFKRVPVITSAPCEDAPELPEAGAVTMAVTID